MFSSAGSINYYNITSKKYSWHIGVKSKNEIFYNKNSEILWNRENIAKIDLIDYNLIYEDKS